MLGKPKYNYGDVVKFKLGDDVKEGIIAIIDRYGTFEGSSDVSYDIMNKEEIQSLFDQLKNGEIDKLDVSKENFMDFRFVLVQRQDFKHFRGTAHIGGSVTYQYLKEPRS